MSECNSPMNKDPNSFRNSGAYTSPGTPDYGDNNHVRGFQKGWCSERVPLSTNSNQRRTSVNILMPFHNGRTLPSKWDDAERWITSPVSGSGVCRNLAPPPQRRIKSKSGPLGPTPGDPYLSSYSPGFQMLESGSSNNIFAGSPFTTGVLVPNGYSFHHGGIDEHRVSQSEDDEKNINYVVSRRDMATLMSPVASPESSPKGRPVVSTSPPPARSEVRDVQVDKRVTMIKIPKRHRKKNRSTEVKDLALTWNPTQGAMESSKVQKEEARIGAWENLQNAKAEASIRKLEMKLEKKKSESMERIMKKLSVAQMKAQEMRNMMSASESPRNSNSNSRKMTSLYRYPKISLRSCFGFHHS